MDRLAELLSQYRSVEKSQKSVDVQLEVGVNISDPGMRAWELIWGVRFTRAPAFEAYLPVIHAALLEMEDLCLAVRNSAFLVRALIERGEDQLASESAATAMGRAAVISHPVRRASALDWLHDAAIFLPIQTDTIARSVFEVCVSSAAWRSQYVLRSVLLRHANVNLEEAGFLISQMPEGKFKNQAVRRFAAGEYELPRRFFW